MECETRYELEAAHPYHEFGINESLREVYNIGGGRRVNVSVLEAIEIAQHLYAFSDAARRGDHIRWISDVRKFQAHYPHWECEYDLERTMREIVEAAQEREAKASKDLGLTA